MERASLAEIPNSTLSNKSMSLRNDPPLTRISPRLLPFHLVYVVSHVLNDTMRERNVRLDIESAIRHAFVRLLAVEQEIEEGAMF